MKPTHLLKFKSRLEDHINFASSKMVGKWSSVSGWKSIPFVAATFVFWKVLTSSNFFRNKFRELSGLLYPLPAHMSHFRRWWGQQEGIQAVQQRNVFGGNYKHLGLGTKLHGISGQTRIIDSYIRLLLNAR